MTGLQETCRRHLMFTVPRVVAVSPQMRLVEVKSHTDMDFVYVLMNSLLLGQPIQCIFNGYFLTSEFTVQDLHRAIYCTRFVLFCFLFSIVIKGIRSGIVC